MITREAHASDEPSTFDSALAAAPIVLLQVWLWIPGVFLRSNSPRFVEGIVCHSGSSPRAPPLFWQRFLSLAVTVLPTLRLR